MSSKALIRPFTSDSQAISQLRLISHIINWWINRAATGNPLLKLLMLISTLLLFCRDVYHNIPPLEPEKLKVFNTVREITGMLLYFRLKLIVLCLCSCCCSFCHVIPRHVVTQRCVCVICRNFEHSVLAWWTQRSVCFLQSHYHSRKISTQVRLRVWFMCVRRVYY